MLRASRANKKGNVSCFVSAFLVGEKGARSWYRWLEIGEHAVSLQGSRERRLRESRDARFLLSEREGGQWPESVGAEKREKSEQVRENERSKKKEKTCSLFAFFSRRQGRAEPLFVSLSTCRRVNLVRVNCHGASSALLAACARERSVENEIPKGVDIKTVDAPQKTKWPGAGPA